MFGGCTLTPYYQDDLVTLHHGDARALPLPDESVDLIATSPPYFQLRSYRDAGEHYDAQIGAEASPAEFVAALVECTREMMRVLKPTGSIFVNLGDKYRPDKSLGLLPHRYAIACADELGLIVRQDQVWSKANGLPESVVDRTRRSHEYVFHLVKSPRYFAAVDEIREQYAPRTQERQGYAARDLAPSSTWASDAGRQDGGNNRGILGFGHQGANPLGKLPGSVWEIATQPLRVPAELGIDHFAAWPMEIPRRLILGWSPREVCTVCGEGRRPVTEKGEHVQAGHGGNYAATPYGAGQHGTGASSLRTIAERTITGYACACPDTSAPSTPGVVLDPFSGTGTTALVAAMHGRQGIGVDASQDYCRLAEWRVNDPKQRERASRAAGTKPPTAKRGAKVMGTAKPQTDLFDLPA